MKDFKLTILSILLFCASAFGQTDSVDYYIDKLGWNSFKERLNVVPGVDYRYEIEYLIQSKDSTKVDKLIHKLSDPSKTVAIHIVLSAFIDHRKFHSRTDEGKWLIFGYNGLIWKRSIYDDHNVVTKKSIKEIIEYWKKNREFIR